VVKIVKKKLDIYGRIPVGRAFEVAKPSGTEHYAYTYIIKTVYQTLIYTGTPEEAKRVKAALSDKWGLAAWMKKV
jgi:hypothetical protein